MDPSPFRERRFAPAEVRQVLRRAAELAEKDPSTPAAEQALTQAQIERSAAELGLSNEVVRRALSEDGAPSEGGAAEATDGKRVLLEDEVEGELPLERHEDVVDAIQVIMGDAGRAQVVGKTLTWMPAQTMSNPQRQLVVTVRSRDGRTRIRIDEKLNQMFWGIWIGFGCGLGLSGAGLAVPIGLATRSGAMGAAVAISAVVVSLVLAHVVYSFVAGRRRRELQRLRSRVVGVVRDEAKRIAATPAAGARAKRGARVAAVETAEAAELAAQAEDEGAEDEGAEAAEAPAPGRRR